MEFLNLLALILSIVTLLVMIVYVYFLLVKKEKIFPAVFIGHMYVIKAIIFAAIGSSFVLSLLTGIIWYCVYYFTERD